MNLDLTVLFQKTIYLEQKRGRISKISMTKIVKEHNGLHYLSTKIQLYTFILLELNIFHKKF